MTKRWIYLLFVAVIAISGSVAVIMLFDGFPKKAPVRAKQVFGWQNGINCHSLIKHNVQWVDKK